MYWILLVIVFQLDRVRSSRISDDGTTRLDLKTLTYQDREEDGGHQIWPQMSALPDAFFANGSSGEDDMPAGGMVCGERIVIDGMQQDIMVQSKGYPILLESGTE